MGKGSRSTDLQHASSRSILITGASRGLGRALAEHYAEAGSTLLLTATSKANLADVRGACERKGASVRCFALNLADRQSIAQCLRELEEAPVPDLYIANAGLFSGRQMDGSEEDISSQQRQLAVNLSGTIELTEAIASRMTARGRGHIALISSLAAIQPQTDSAAYSASKAGLAAYGKARRIALREAGVRLSILYPGHVETDQTTMHMGPLPGLISANGAVRLIARALAKGKTEYAFPRHIHWLVRLSSLLPVALQARVNAPFRFRVRQARVVKDQDHE